MQFKPITAIVVLLLVVASLSISGCTLNYNAPASSATPTALPTITPISTVTPSYTSAKGYSIKYESDWGKPQEQQNSAFVVFLTPANNETENLNVQVVSRTGATLTTVKDELRSNAQSYDDFKLIETTNTTLAGLPAYKIVYTATVDGDQLKLLQIVTVKDGKVFIITYKGASTNYDKYLSAAQQMIDSFQTK